MKVKIEITVDIDVDAWTLNYGIEGAKKIREDVKESVEQGVTEHLRELGMLNAGV